MLGTNQICLLYPEFTITRLDKKVNMDLGLNNLKESDRYNREFVITEFVLNEFVIAKFVITKFAITEFVITKFHCNLSNGMSLSLCKSDHIKRFPLYYILLYFDFKKLYLKMISTC